ARQEDNTKTATAGLFASFRLLSVFLPSVPSVTLWFVHPGATMPEYTYEALAAPGQRSNGTLTAGSERETVSMLDPRGLDQRRRLVKGQGAPLGGGGSNRKVKRSQVAPCVSEHADLLPSGGPLLRSLDIRERQSASPALAEVSRYVRARVADGTGLS